MHKTHDKTWPLIFSGWVQGVLDDERSSAFSILVYSETRRTEGQRRAAAASRPARANFQSEWAPVLPERQAVFLRQGTRRWQQVQDIRVSTLVPERSPRRSFCETSPEEGVSRGKHLLFQQRRSLG